MRRTVSSPTGSTSSKARLLTSNHEILLGRSIADALHKEVGDTMDLSGYRYSVVGIYESKISWEEIGGIITLRDAQVFMGRPRKVTIFAVRLKDPQQAVDMVEQINKNFPTFMPHWQVISSANSRICKIPQR